MDPLLLAEQHLPSPLLKFPGVKQRVDPRQIIRFEADGNYTYVWFIDVEKPILLAQTLKYFESELQDFIRVSKVSLLNPRFIKGLQRTINRSVSVVLYDGKTIPISRRRLLPTQERIRSQLTH